MRTTTEPTNTTKCMKDRARLLPLSSSTPSSLSHPHYLIVIMSSASANQGLDKTASSSSSSSPSSTCTGILDLLDSNSAALEDFWYKARDYASSGGHIPSPIHGRENLVGPPNCTRLQQELLDFVVVQAQGPGATATHLADIQRVGHTLGLSIPSGNLATLSRLVARLARLEWHDWFAAVLREPPSARANGHDATHHQQPHTTTNHWPPCGSLLLHRMVTRCVNACPWMDAPCGPRKNNQPKQEQTIRLSIQTTPKKHQSIIIIIMENDDEEEQEEDNRVSNHPTQRTYKKN